MLFYVGVHQPSDAHHFARCMVSVNRLCRRKRGFSAREWILDSGAFTEVTQHGGYRTDAEDYAGKVVRWSLVGRMVAAVSQDYMCEPFVLARTGLSVKRHQALTIERYQRIAKSVGQWAYVMPVIQGYSPEEYSRHTRDYGSILPAKAWCGVGSVCKRNANPESVLAVLEAILAERPDLRLHGFGVKLTALADRRVWDLLYSSDSMAWSSAARWEGRDANSWLEAQNYVDRVQSLAYDNGQ